MRYQAIDRLADFIEARRFVERARGLPQGFGIVAAFRQMAVDDGKHVVHLAVQGRRGVCDLLLAQVRAVQELGMDMIEIDQAERLPAFDEAVDMLNQLLVLAFEIIVPDIVDERYQRRLLLVRDFKNLPRYRRYQEVLLVIIQQGIGIAVADAVTEVQVGCDRGHVPPPAIGCVVGAQATSRAWCLTLSSTELMAHWVIIS